MVTFGFLPQNLKGGRDLHIVVLLEKECSFNGVDNVGWWGHLNTTSRLKNFELYAHTGGGATKTF